MGVRRTDFVLIGADIGYDKYDDSIWEEDDNDYDKYKYHRKKAGDIVYIIDGMGGNYFIVGQIIEIDDEGYNGFGLIDTKDLDLQYDEIKVKVKDFIRDKFIVDTEEFNNKIEPRLLVLTHFS